MQPKHGGAPCESTSDSEPCNVDSCDKNCVLEDWSAWSECTKQCNEGTVFRTKGLISEAEGDGLCPGEDTEFRYEEKYCHTERCPKVETSDGLIKCNNTVDIVLILDASGSVKPEGWEKTQVFATNLVQALGSAAKIGVLQYSGPEDFEDYGACKLGQKKPSECGCNWLTEMSEEPAAVVKTIEGAPFTKGSTLTSMALSMAKAELMKNRRQEASEKIAILITDGKPLSKRNTFLKAQELRAVARLMIVTVGKKAPSKLAKEWASGPAAQNVFTVNDFMHLENDLINNIIENACPSLVTEDLESATTTSKFR